MKKIAVYFPGIGYHSDKPLLYYGRDLAYELGFEEYLNIQYKYQAGNIRGNDEKIQEAFEELYRQTEDQLKTVDWCGYEEVLFVSKSIGTIVAAAYAKRHQIVCKHILYTPLAQTFAFAPKDGIAFTGTSDPWVHTEEIVTHCHQNEIPVVILEGANHSLEVEDVRRNIDILRDVMDQTRAFLNKQV